MTPQEFVQYVSRSSIDAYLQNQQAPIPTYQVDDLNDDVLYMADLLARVGEDNLTDEQVQDMLDQAKQNPELFQKQVDAIRNEYRQVEDTNRYQEQAMARQEQIDQYNRFAESIENEIRRFTNFHGYDSNMDESEMEELYDFITGFDKAGVSIFGKALNDPAILVRMAWYALNGDKAIQDINNYWTNELKKARGTNRRQPRVEIRKSDNQNDFDDLDDF